MKIKILFLCSVLLLLWSCSSPLGSFFIPSKPLFIDKISYEGYSFDEIWSAAIGTLAESLYQVTFSDKEGGVLQARNSIGNEVKLTIFKEKENVTSVHCQLTTRHMQADVAGRGIFASIRLRLQK